MTIREQLGRLEQPPFLDRVAEGLPVKDPALLGAALRLDALAVLRDGDLLGDRITAVPICSLWA